jgi:methyltransferase (TIGR00027 family)
MTMNQQIFPVPGLAMTALWSASARGQESAREDRLFNDPWATTLAGQPGAAWLAQLPPGATLPMVIRTCFFDDFLQRVAYEHGLRQFVLVAAGLDTRSYRLTRPEGSLSEFLLNSPLAGTELNLERVRDLPRSVEIES